MAGFTLVPSEFFSTEDSHKILSEVVPLQDTDIVRHIELPKYKAVLVYVKKSDDESATEPPIVDLLHFAPTISGHNRLAVSLDNNYIYIVLAEGEKLLLANAYPAADVVTAEYFIFASLREFQINPRMTTIHFRGEVPSGLTEEMFRHFRAVEFI
ncbi:MAG: DUF3822 family protein [Bacteroidales bacterium]|nr:DUF3822 family protein [Bacteroidales bacterium]HPH53768.1 DUF3822 family protein [Bacteroidales bacterium]